MSKCSVLEMTIVNQKHRREEFMTTNLVLEKEKERLAGKRKMSDVVLFKKGQRPSSALAKENSEV